MITAIANQSNEIELLFEDFDIDCFYSIGEGIICLLNYDLHYLNTLINTQIKSCIQNKTMPINKTNKFIDSIQIEFTKIHPYFYSLQHFEIQNFLIESLITFLLKDSFLDKYENKDLGYYKDQPVLVPFPVLKENKAIPISLELFSQYVKNLIGFYSGFIEYLSDDFSEKVLSEYPFIDETTAITIYAYLKYISYFNSEGSTFWRLSGENININKYDLHIVRYAASEFIERVLSSSGVISAIDFFDYILSKSNDDIIFSENFSNLIYPPDGNEYEIECLYDLIRLEIMLICNSGVKISRCEMCGKYIIQNKSKICSDCRRNKKYETSDVQKVFRKYYEPAMRSYTKKDIIDVTNTFINALCELKALAKHGKIEFLQYERNMSCLNEYFKETKTGSLKLDAFRNLCQQVIDLKIL